MSLNTSMPWREIESVMRRDPAQRGVASYCWNNDWLAAGHLRLAAESLAADAKSVAIVTGFCAFDGVRWTAETDGPPGALYLARALLTLGVEAIVVSDAYCIPVLEAGCDVWNLPRNILCKIPFESGNSTSAERRSNNLAQSHVTRTWVEDFLRQRGSSLTHLISIERCGPSHTTDSIARQPGSIKETQIAFEDAVPMQGRNRCHNIRGIDITPHTAKVHLLFEAVQRRPVTTPPLTTRHSPLTTPPLTPPITIGLADGGNEIGMGSIPWEVLRNAIRQGPAARVACRITTDFTLLAGVSNWAAYALASTVCAQRGRHDLLTNWPADDLQRLIVAMVEQGGAVDGLTGKHEATVDGLPLSAYLHVFDEILSFLR